MKGDNDPPYAATPFASVDRQVTLETAARVDFIGCLPHHPGPRAQSVPDCHEAIKGLPWNTLTTSKSKSSTSGMLTHMALRSKYAPTACCTGSSPFAIRTNHGSGAWSSSAVHQAASRMRPSVPGSARAGCGEKI
jgi:hypothetical protein